MTDGRRSNALQVLGSLLVALAVVAVTVTLVANRLGPGIDDDRGREQRESREERREERLERLEDRAERRKARRGN